MKRLRCFALAVFLILSATVAHAVDADLERDRRLRTTLRTSISPHDDSNRVLHVTSITFSPDGWRLVASYFRPAINRPGTDWAAWTTQWDLKTGKRLRFQNHREHYSRPAYFRSVGPVVRSASSPGNGLKAFSERGKVLVRRSDGELFRQFPAGGWAVAFSPDGKRLAAGDNRGIVRIWDIAGGRIVRTLRLDDRPGNTVLVAAVQCYSKFGDPTGNRKKLAGLVRQAAWRGAKIIVLPETAVTGYLSADLKKTWRAGNRPVSKGLEGVDPKDAAETVPGPSTKMFGKIADKWGVYLTVPLLEVDRKTGRYYNTSVLLGPDGSVLIHYRKRDPWLWAERGWAAAGDRGNPVVDTPFGRLGLLICYDIHDQAKVMARLKIDTLLYSVAWVEDKGSDWFAKRLPAIAKANGFNIIAANWTVPKNLAPKWHGYGQSRIIGTAGKVLAKVEDDLRDEIVYTELPLPAPPRKAAPPAPKK